MRKDRLETFAARGEYDTGQRHPGRRHFVARADRKVVRGLVATPAAAALAHFDTRADGQRWFGRRGHASPKAT
jgi:hypothetical protein